MSKYEYFYNDVVFRVSDGKTERYAGKGKWIEVDYDPKESMNPKSEKYDFGETSKETEKDALELMQNYDKAISLKNQ